MNKEKLYKDLNKLEFENSNNVKNLEMLLGELKDVCYTDEMINVLDEIIETANNIKNIHTLSKQKNYFYNK